MAIPIVHITDLYHPPQDPDDHIDLATIMALPELDLRGVILDGTREFLESAPAGRDIRRDPGFVPVAQLSYLTGRAIPVAAGPPDPLRHGEDTALDRPARDQAGIVLLLDLLHSSSQPLVISVVGSTRVLAAAYNRDPVLLKKKTGAILLSAGSLDASREEWNVMLDRAAYVRLWRSGLPIHWYPCTTDRGPFSPDHEYGSYWQTTHEALMATLPQPLRAWFAYALTANTRGDIIGALDEEGRGAAWENILAATRNMWSTTCLVMAAGRCLAHTSQGWRFLREEEAAGHERWPWELLPLTATASDGGSMTWHQSSAPSANLLFRRAPGAAFGSAMADALRDLLSNLLPESPPPRNG